MEQRTTKITDIPDDVLKIIYLYRPEILPRLGLTSKEIARVSNKVLCEKPITDVEFDKFTNNNYVNFAMMEAPDNGPLNLYFINTLGNSYDSINIYLHDLDVDKQILSDLSEDDLLARANKISVDISSTDKKYASKYRITYNNQGSSSTDIRDARRDNLKLDLLSTYRILKERKICNGSLAPLISLNHGSLAPPLVTSVDRQYDDWAKKTILKMLEDNYIKYESKVFINNDEDVKRPMGDIKYLLGFYIYIYLNYRVLNLPGFQNYSFGNINVLKTENGDILLPTWNNINETVYNEDASYWKLLRITKLIDKFYPIL